MKIKLFAIVGMSLLTVLAFTYKVQPDQDQPKPKSKKSSTKSSKKSKKVAVPAQPDTITTASGLRYVITKSNPTGEKVDKGDLVTAHYTGTLTDGKKFDSSRDRNDPFSFIVGRGEVIAGWDEGFSYLRVGEQATLIIPSKLGYGEMDMGEIPANSTLIFDVEVMSLKKPLVYNPYSGEGKDTITLPSGLRYIIIEEGNKEMKAMPEQTAFVYYAGYLMNGKKFDGNFERFNPLELKVVDGRVIKGWQEILPLMNKGMKVRAILPPSLGYGNKNAGSIPPNSTLIFDMFLYDLK